MDMMWYRRRGLMVTPHIESVTGAIASFNGGYNKIPIKSLICNIEPIQEGTGDPSPDNIRPISGRTGLSVVRTDINVWNEEWEVGQYHASSNTVEKIPSSIHIRSKNPIPVKPKTTYYMNSAGKNVHLIVADADENVLYRTVTLNNGLFTTPDKGAFVYFNMASAYGTTYKHDISINYPRTDTGYHPYKGNTYSVNWETEAGTVYGGTLDVVSGKLTVDSGYIASYNGEALPSTWISDRDVYASGTTPTIGAQVVYELATPTEIQLTPQEVKTILDENNIWCDSGDITVDYWKWGK